MLSQTKRSCYVLTIIALNSTMILKEIIMKLILLELQPWERSILFEIRTFFFKYRAMTCESNDFFV